MKKFGFILPVYNGGEYVIECVSSILSQSLTDFNLIVLDNKSTDGTSQFLNTLKDSRVIIYPVETKLSIEQNWARIREIPKNEFMTITGHDDVFHPNYLQEMDALINKHPNASLYQAHFNFIDGEGKKIKPCLPMDEVQYGHEFLACQFARTMDSMGTGYMMRTADYDRLGGIPTDYPNLIFADYHLWLSLTLLSYKATTSAFCFDYRIHSSVSKITNGEAYQLAFEKYIYFISELMKTNEKIRSAVEKYGHDMLLYFCESLSHRLLKTAPAARKIRVGGFIDKCMKYASILIPGQDFKPLDTYRINIARQVDSNPVSRKLFYLLKGKR